MFTALLIAALVAAGTVIGAGIGAALAGRRRRLLTDGDMDNREGVSGHLIERALTDLRVGDVIQRDDRDYLVEGTIHYDEAGNRWISGRLVDGEHTRWLVVGMERATDSAKWCQIDPSINVGGYPPETIATQQRRYQLQRRGTATTTVTGAAGISPGQGAHPEAVSRCRWWRYTAPGSYCLIVEQWGEDFRILRGMSIDPDSIEMLPGS